MVWWTQNARWQVESWSCRGRNCAFCYRWWMLSGGSPGWGSTVRGPPESISIWANFEDFTQNMKKCTLTKKGKQFVEPDMNEDGKERQNVYSNLYSQAVTHPSTNRSQPCLTSVIGRELVFSRWYGRRHFEQLDNQDRFNRVLCSCEFCQR